MSRPAPDDSALWPLGTPPRLGRPLPRFMHALTIHRDQYGPPSESVRSETVPAPRLRPVDEQKALPLPAPLHRHTPERLAAALLTYGTAYRAVVERLRVSPGDSVLVMGGGKGTSFAAAQIAKALGARVILVGTMGKPKGVALVQADRAGRSIEDYEDAFLGEKLRAAEPARGVFLDIRLAGDIGVVTLNRPETQNALSEDLLAQLAAVLREIGTLRTIEGRPVRALVLTGAGRAFVAGADVTEFLGRPAEAIASLAAKKIALFSELESLVAPVIAVVDGFAAVEIGLADECCSSATALARAVRLAAEFASGTVTASPGGQEWIRRFLAKDPSQSSFLSLLDLSAPPGKAGRKPISNAVLLASSSP